VPDDGGHLVGRSQELNTWQAGLRCMNALPSSQGQGGRAGVDTRNSPDKRSILMGASNESKTGFFNTTRKSG